MNTGVIGMSMMLVAGLASATGTAATGDVHACQGRYPVMLMTNTECQTYVRQMHFLEAQGKAERLAELKQQHDRLLEERATACPCASQLPPQAQPVLIVAGDC